MSISIAMDDVGTVQDMMKAIKGSGGGPSSKHFIIVTIDMCGNGI